MFYCLSAMLPVEKGRDCSKRLPPKFIFTAANTCLPSRFQWLRHARVFTSRTTPFFSYYFFSNKILFSFFSSISILSLILSLYFLYTFFSPFSGRFAPQYLPMILPSSSTFQHIWYCFSIFYIALAEWGASPTAWTWRLSDWMQRYAKWGLI